MKRTYIFIFTLLCGASKGFIKALKEVKLKLIFILIRSEMHEAEKVKLDENFQILEKSCFESLKTFRKSFWSKVLKNPT